MNRLRIGIVGNGPEALLPELSKYKEEIDLWIGADRGAFTLINSGLPLDYALGDFDSVNKVELEQIRDEATQFKIFPEEKDETDIELALEQAFLLKPETIIMFGVTGGRKDHELINIQLLYSIVKHGMKGVIIDKDNYLELTLPGRHHLNKDNDYSSISFIPFTEEVEGLTLNGFYYPLVNERISWGSTRCISNKLSAESGTYSYEQGILLLIKSRDSIPI